MHAHVSFQRRKALLYLKNISICLGLLKPSRSRCGWLKGKGATDVSKGDLESWRHSKEVLHGSNFQLHSMGGSHRTPCREAFNDQLVWIAHETNERHDTV